MTRTGKRRSRKYRKKLEPTTIAKRWCQVGDVASKIYEGEAEGQYYVDNVIQLFPLPPFLKRKLWLKMRKLERAVRSKNRQQALEAYEWYNTVLSVLKVPQEVAELALLHVSEPGFWNTTWWQFSLWIEKARWDETKWQVCVWW